MHKELEKIMKNKRGLTCMIRNFQMYEVKFYDEYNNEKESEYCYKSLDLVEAIKGASKLYDDLKKGIKPYHGKEYA